jgi:transposase-like protein
MKGVELMTTRFISKEEIENMKERFIVEQFEGKTYTVKCPKCGCDRLVEHTHGYLGSNNFKYYRCIRCDNLISVVSLGGK